MPHRSIPCLSGAVFLRTEKLFREEVGDAAVERARAGLAPGQRDVLESAVTSAWIPASIIDTLYTRIAAESERDLGTLYPEIVKKGVAQTLRTVWRALLRLTTDRALISRTPLIYARGHSVGKIVSTIDAPGDAAVVLTGWPGMPDLRRVGVAAGIEAVLEVAGRKNVAVTHEGTDDGAVYAIRWDP